MQAMSNSSPTYEPLFTTKFERIIRSKKRRDVALVEAAKKGVKRIVDSPYSHNGWLKGNLRGKHKKYVGRDYRIVYAICEECRRLGHAQVNRCEFCDEATDKTVVFFFVGPKKERHGDYDV